MNHQASLAQDLSSLILRIKQDEENFKPEKRSVHREPWVAPAAICVAGGDCLIDGFTRNISPEGLCLIARQPITIGSVISLQLFCETFKDSFEATCCWNEKFGNTYWVSGWTTKTKIPVGKILKEDFHVEPEAPTANQYQTAIPAAIHSPTAPVRIPAFTRHISENGACLVGREKTLIGQTSVLEFVRRCGDSEAVAATCVWTKPFANGHWVSGWSFV